MRGGVKMQYAYSIIMCAFAVALLIYAGLMALTKDYNMLPLRSRASVKPKNPKKYAFQLSKVIALVSVAPAISALIGLWNILVAAIVLILAVVLLIWLGTKIMKDVE